MGRNAFLTSRSVRRDTGAALGGIILMLCAAGVASAQSGTATVPRPDHPRVAEAVRLSDDQPAQSSLLWAKIIRDLEASAGPRARQTLAARAWLANDLSRLGGTALVRAVAEARTVHDIALELWGVEDDLTQLGRIRLGSALYLQGNYFEAQPVLQAALDHIVAHPGATGVDMGPSITRALAQTYEYLGDPARARQTLNRVDAAATTSSLVGLEQRMTAAESAGDWTTAARMARDYAQALRSDPTAEDGTLLADNADLKQAEALARIGTAGSLETAETLARAVRNRRASDPRKRGLASATLILSRIVGRAGGRRAEVLSLLREAVDQQALDLGRGHPTTIEAEMLLAMTMAEDGQTEAALNRMVEITNPGSEMVLNRSTLMLLHITGAMLALKNGDLAAAHSMQSGAADVVKDNLTTGNRAAALDQTRDVFRMQVSLAYHYATTLP